MHRPAPLAALPERPFGQPLLVYRECHGHCHFTSVARYARRARGQ
jgi:hypothetical protein